MSSISRVTRLSFLENGAMIFTLPMYSVRGGIGLWVGLNGSLTSLNPFLIFFPRLFCPKGLGGGLGILRWGEFFFKRYRGSHVCKYVSM